MLDDNDEQIRASIRAQADSDAKAFLAQMLAEEDSTGIPDPPTIEVSETSGNPINTNPLVFKLGTED